MFSKLRKLSHLMRQKRGKVMEEMELRKQKELQRKSRQEQRRLFSKNFVEQEAEQGSDNEEHDDVVKPREGDEEDSDDGGQANLIGLIDDQIGDLNDDNEERAYKIFLKQLRQQEKDGIFDFDLY